MALNNNLSIFFDLETTDLLRVGQILNYGFLVVDKNWEVIDELAGTIKISPLQLPSAAAILANRTMVSEHQLFSSHNEQEALGLINAFIRRYSKESPDLPLIGYNSAGFDTHYLRTSLLRNGYNPYLPVQGKDLLILTQSLLISNEQFRKKALSQEKPNLKLATYCKLHGLLDGEQLHESRADVELTIKLAKTYAEVYGKDVRVFQPHQLRPYHELVQPIVVQRGRPNISGGTCFTETVMVHLITKGKSSLWIDLDEFKKREGTKKVNDALKYIKHSAAASCRILDTDQDLYAELALRARAFFDGVTLDQMFTEKICYIEQWIYKLSLSEIEKVVQMITDNEVDVTASEDAQALYSRSLLDNIDDPLENEAFVEYCKRRYGGSMIVDQTETVKGIKPKYHKTAVELYGEVRELVATTQGRDLELMRDLLDFYEGSLVRRISPY